MRRKNHVRTLGVNGSDDFFNRCRGEGGLHAAADLAGLEDSAFGGNVAHVENLCPAEAEPAVADDQTLAMRGELAGDGLHAEGAAAGNDGGGLGVIDFFQDARNVAHDALKALRHMVQRTVGIDHRIFEQAIGIGLGQQCRHVVSPWVLYLSEHTAKAGCCASRWRLTGEFRRPLGRLR